MPIALYLSALFAVPAQLWQLLKHFRKSIHVLVALICPKGHLQHAALWANLVNCNAIKVKPKDNAASIELMQLRQRTLEHIARTFCCEIKPRAKICDFCLRFSIQIQFRCACQLPWQSWQSNCPPHPAAPRRQQLH